MAKLIVKGVILDKYMVGSQGSYGKSRITSKDNTVLCQRETDDLIVVHRPVVQNIESEQPHPLR